MPSRRVLGHTGVPTTPARQRIPDGSEFCSFSGDTAVATADGDVPISDIESGDQVLAYNETTGATETYTVTATWAHEDPVVTTVTLDGEAIETTPEHPFYVLLKSWVPAGQLQAGDSVRRADGSYGVVEDVTHDHRPQVMYNFTITAAHTYFVGDGQWLVHNACPGDRLPLFRPGDKTRGILDTGSEEIDLISGRSGPAAAIPGGTAGFNKRFWSNDHVEAHAIALMRQRNLSNVDLYINNTPCPGPLGCEALMPHRLPEGATLRLHIKKGTNQWERRTYIGLPDSQWSNP